MDGVDVKAPPIYIKRRKIKHETSDFKIKFTDILQGVFYNPKQGYKTCTNTAAAGARPM